MAYYTYYQNSQPTWGTQQYQFLPPPMPMYQPQPSCKSSLLFITRLSPSYLNQGHGGDYYRAHSDSPDKCVFF